MVWLKKLFSPKYRKAVNEAKKGNFLEAASLFANINETKKALEMYLKTIEVMPPQSSIEDKIAILNKAIAIIEGDQHLKKEPITYEVYRKIGSLFVKLAEQKLRSNEEYRRLIKLGADFLEKGEDFIKAGELFEQLSLLEDATRCYEKGGEIEKLEKVTEKLIQIEREQKLLKSLYEEYNILFQTGERKRAIEKLQQCISIAKENKTLYLEELLKLKKEVPERKVITININNSIYNFIGENEIIIGRDVTADFMLKDPEVSRKHLLLKLTEDGASIKDLGSSGGTFLGDLKIEDEFKIKTDIKIRLGRSSLIVIENLDKYILLRVEEGIDEGKTAFIIKKEGVKIMENNGVYLYFEDLFPVVDFRTPVSLSLNGKKIFTSKIYLIKGDSIKFGDNYLKLLK